MTETKGFWTGEALKAVNGRKPGRMNCFKTIRKNVSATAAVSHGVYIPTETILLKYPRSSVCPRNSRVHGRKIVKNCGSKPLTLVIVWLMELHFWGFGIKHEF